MLPRFCDTLGMKAKAMGRDFEYYIGVAEDAGKRSDGLWATMNNLIADILRTSRKRGRTLKDEGEPG